MFHVCPSTEMSMPSETLLFVRSTSHVMQIDENCAEMFAVVYQPWEKFHLKTMVGFMSPPSFTVQDCYHPN